MAAFWSGTVAAFLAADASAVLQRLALQQVRHFRTNEIQQIRAWESQIAILRRCLLPLPEAAGWRLLLEYPLLRLGRRIDAVLVSDRAVLVLEFKTGAIAFDAGSREQVEDYALDLQDFHAACRGHPIIPILVATDAAPCPAMRPLLLGGVTAVMDASAATLPGLLRELAASVPPARRPLDPDAWEHAPYRPVPTIVEAACMLYARHGVGDIAAARADAHNLTRTTTAILAAGQAAHAERQKLVLFVTGIPGAGKTLCGLNAVFGAGRDAGATFLTGNPTLVHVLREALARDAARGTRESLRAARQRTESAIQVLPLFRDHHAGSAEIPAEHVAVIDEAQRCWSREHAIAKTRDRRVRLTDSEPGHLLDIMDRHRDWAAIICLVGSGQEIHTGEGGLAEWGAALRLRPHWRIRAAPDALAAADVRQRLPDLPGLITDSALHLDVPVRSIRCPRAAEWVDAVLHGNAAQARTIAQEAGGVPFSLTRDLAAMRAALRARARGTRRAGLIASSGAARLRADGPGVELPHMEVGAVAHWFLDRWPDVRASDALEVVATEFSCQGLELDYAGLCWGGDLIRQAGAWLVRDFRGTRWTIPRGAEAIGNRVNAYRVLLTRARYETVIWVPRGDPGDATRQPAELDAIADYLLACGAGELGEDAMQEDESAPELALL